MKKSEKLKIEKYLISKLSGLLHTGDLKLKNEDYIFTIEMLANDEIYFENSIFEVKKIKFTEEKNVIVKLSVSASYIDFVINKSKPHHNEIINKL